MRILLYIAAAAAVAMASSPEAVRSALAATASALFEATPFLFAGVAISRVLGRRRAIVEYLSCGCGAGPSARSLPAAAATWLTFGPFVAVARFVAATLAARALSRIVKRCDTGHHSDPSLTAELAALLPATILAGAATLLVSRFDPAALWPIGSALFGGALGFVAAPCGFGAVALAGALRIRAPLAAAGFLCVAGIVDVRALRRSSQRALEHDAFAYVILAIALAVVAWRKGDALVNPAFTAALALCACAAAVCAAIYRRRRCTSARLAPALMLVGALLGAPPPQYTATETTMGDLFAGEHLVFTGTLVRDAHASAVVRYAITCCRADAAPRVVRLDRSPPYPAGTWLRAEGTVENHGSDLRLALQRVERVPAPNDPFVYL